MLRKSTNNTVECWGLYEIVLEGPQAGNPYTDVQLKAKFTYRNRVVEPEGFYDGEGSYKIRFMPDTVGTWAYETYSNCDALSGKSGQVICTEPSEGNHGPVGIAHQHHFCYADKKPYVPVGTTCYAWIHQKDEVQAQTLKTLKTSPFNKMRMLVFPKYYGYNLEMPAYHQAFEIVDGHMDFSRFNPAYFRHLEKRIGDLLALGIETDLILLHPYDYKRWNYDQMGSDADDRYIRYVVARLAAYRNIWWSLSNEYDLMKEKTMADWDRFFRIIQTCDPYQHLRSIHNGPVFYDHGKPWVTHASIQHSDLIKVAEWRDLYKKPVIVDECCYEGDLPDEWGHDTAEEMVEKFWRGFTCGGYVGHGETFWHPDNLIWWAKGGVLRGQSPERIRFLKQIIEEGPDEGLTLIRKGTTMTCVGKPGAYYLMYFGRKQPSRWKLDLPEDGIFGIEIIDTWEMTINKLDGFYTGQCEIDLPAKPYIALRAVILTRDDYKCEE